MRRIFFGPPGTGKTTTLLRLLEEELRGGVKVEDIAFLTFTRRAKREAVERVEKALGMSPRDLPHFRTIHSMAFKALRLSEGDVVGKKQLLTFGQAMGLEFGDASATELASEGIASQSSGDRLLALDNIARLRGVSLREAWGEARTGIEWPVVDHFSRSYSKYKADTGLLDFTDVLTEFVRSGARLPVRVCFIDEAQDLSALQWFAALQATDAAERQYVAGDDDQAIYRWAGADVSVFMGLEGERVMLDQSHRLPSAIHTIAHKVLSRIKSRVPKEFRPRPGDAGLVVRHPSITGVKVGVGEEWLWLVRNRYLIPQLREHLEAQGVVYTQHGYSSIKDAERSAIYTWERLRAGQAVEGAAVREVYKGLRSRVQVGHGHKALQDVDDEAMLTDEQLREHHGLIASGPWYDVLLTIPPTRRAYYRKLLREQGSLRMRPQVQLETIHGAKGAEADHVALILDQSRRVWDESRINEDDEHRVWYVGATRARKALHVIEPAGRWGYQMPQL